MLDSAEVQMVAGAVLTVCLWEASQRASNKCTSPRASKAKGFSDSTDAEVLAPKAAKVQDEKPPLAKTPARLSAEV
jgi:hypothetical protein